MRGALGTRIMGLGLSQTETSQTGWEYNLCAHLHIRRVITNLCDKSPQLQCEEMGTKNAEMTSIRAHCS